MYMLNLSILIKRKLMEMSNEVPIIGNETILQDLNCVYAYSLPTAGHMRPHTVRGLGL